MSNRFQGKTVVITGANSGIGEAAMLAFAREGASIVAAARRADQLEKAAEAVRTATGAEILCVPTDISDPAAVKVLMNRAVETFGHLDVLAAAAGILEPGLRPIDRVVDEDLDRVLNINTKGTIYCLREATRIMRDQTTPGAIVCVSSIAGVTGCSCSAYTASKAALVGVIKNAAIRFAGTNVRLNCICPGTVVTPMTTGGGEMDEEMFTALSKHCDLTVPPCQPEEVADVMLLFASDEARAMTGQVVVVDHGANL